MKTVSFTELTRTLAVPPEGIMLPEETIGLPTSLHVTSVLISPGCIQARILTLANQIAKEHREKHIYSVVIEKGASAFFKDLKNQLELLGKKVSYDNITASSYRGTTSIGKVTLKGDIILKKKEVLLIEDIIDSGRTVDVVVKHLRKKGASSIKVCTLLDYPKGRKRKITVDYSGFTIPPAFVIGYGLDYNQKYRDLPFVAVLKK